MTEAENRIVQLENKVEELKQKNTVTFLPIVMPGN